MTLADSFQRLVEERDAAREDVERLAEVIDELREERDAALAEVERLRGALEEALHHLTRAPVPGWSLDLTNFIRDALEGR